MKNSIFCENKYKENFIFSNEQIVIIADNFLEYIFSHNLAKDILTEEYTYSLEIMLCDNNFIHEINRKYRNIDKPTDVITFALYYDTEDKLIVDNTINLGQIIISVDKVFSQAGENNIMPELEFKNLLAHGVLHLLGFDHLDDKSLENMIQLQSEMIEDINNVKI